MKFTLRIAATILVGAAVQAAGCEKECIEICGMKHPVDASNHVVRSNLFFGTWAEQNVVDAGTGRT